MLVTLGRDMLARLLQYWNAPQPILVALGKDTLVRFEQPSNAESFILKTLLEKLPDIDLSIIELKTLISDYFSVYSIKS